MDEQILYVFFVLQKYGKTPGPSPTKNSAAGEIDHRITNRPTGPGPMVVVVLVRAATNAYICGKYEEKYGNIIPLWNKYSANVFKLDSLQILFCPPQSIKTYL